ncbi:MAG: hypothetical protein JWN57_495 [Frankiales bacterium]|nr:hypothetical protein [Frankiales bacterium]
MPLTVSPCQTLCDWRRTRACREGLPLFACTGCGSQWVRTQPWSPRQADGSWPDGVREELLSHGPGGAAAGNAGSCRTTGS